MSQPKTTVATPTASQPSQAAQQLNLLQMRVKDMTTQLDTAIKAMVQENASLRKQLTDLNAKQQTSTQQTAKQ